MKGFISFTFFMVSTACGSTQETSILPWLKVRTYTSSSFLAFAGPSKTTTYFVKVGASWRQLDDEGVGGATVLTPQAVLYYDNGVPRLIHQGETTATSPCGPPLVAVTVPPGADVYDCVNVAAGPVKAIATSVRVRRMNAAGSLLRDQILTVERPGRVFLRPMVSFYDDDRAAYLVTMSEDSAAPAACALVAIGPAAPTFTNGPADLNRGACSEAPVWSKLISRRLEHAK